jgi:glycosyltransferase involved in cell wall biosynthesis
VAGLRVLMTGKGWFPDELGGLDRYFRSLYDALRDDGVDVEGVVVGPASEPSPGVRVASRHDRPLVQRVLAVDRAVASRPRPDVVDVHFALYGLLPVLRGRARAPLVVHFHGPWADESVAAGDAARLSHGARLAIERSVYRRAARLLVLSQAFKQTLVESYGVAPWNVTVVGPGIDTRWFTPGDRASARARFGIPDDAFLLVAVRRLVPRMGLDVLIDAVAELGADGGRRAPVLLIGGDGPRRDALEQQVERLGVGDRVRLLGRVADDAVVDLYRAADFNVVPSVAHEGFGLIVLEAAACGTPSIVTDVGGLPELGSRIDRHLVVPRGDAVALSRTIAEYASGERAAPDPATLRETAESFEWHRTARRTRRVFEEVVTGERDGRMRVVYLDHVARLSGGELALLRLLPALSEVDAHVLLAEDGPLASQLRCGGVSVEVLPWATSARDFRKDDVRIGGSAVGAAAATARYVAALTRRLRTLRPDIVHANSLKAGVYGGFAARAAGIPFVWHVRDRIAPDYLSPAGVWMIRTLTRRLADVVVANSYATQATLPRTTNARVIHSVVPEVVEPPRLARRTDGAPDRLRIGMIGRLAPWKGQDVFLRAFADAFPDGAHEAVIVGSAMFGETDYEQRCRRLAEELGIASRVDWRGFRDDIWDELSRFDVLVHASVTPEPFGQVVVEGMAAGLPVVTTTEGGPAEFVEHERTGLQVAPRDTRALAEALARLARDAALRARLSEAARRKAGEFSGERISAQVHGLYRDLLGRRS